MRQIKTTFDIRIQSQCEANRLINIGFNDYRRRNCKRAAVVVQNGISHRSAGYNVAALLCRHSRHSAQLNREGFIIFDAIVADNCYADDMSFVSIADERNRIGSIDDQVCQFRSAQNQFMCQIKATLHCCVHNHSKADDLIAIRFRNGNRPGNRKRCAIVIQNGQARGIGSRIDGHIRIAAADLSELQHDRLVGLDHQIVNNPVYINGDFGRAGRYRYATAQGSVIDTCNRTAADGVSQDRIGVTRLTQNNGKCSRRIGFIHRS